MRLRNLLFLCAAMISSAQAQWRVQSTGVTADLQSVYALSDQLAWASGADGTVLRTVNGGSTWEHCAVPPGAQHLQFSGVQGFDAKMAIVMSDGKGDLSRLYKTTDSCRTWTLMLTNPDPEGVWQSMQFRWTPGQPPQGGFFSAGVLLGRPTNGEFPLYTSKDYGTTWRSLQEDEAYSPGPSATANAGESFLLSSNAALTTTTEDNTFAFVTSGEAGGRLLYPQSHREEFNSVSLRYSFSDLHLPSPASSTSGVYAVGARRTGASSVDLMVVGGDARHPDTGTAVLIRRTGLRKIFAPTATAATQPPHGIRTSVAYDEASNTWITVGPNGTDASTDDGRTWHSLTPAMDSELDTDWQAISLPFVVGRGGHIGKLSTMHSTEPAHAPLIETASTRTQVHPEVDRTPTNLIAGDASASVGTN